MIRIDVLPDDVLLEIFDFCVYVNYGRYLPSKRKIEAWQSLVHVCRRWRCLVFGSPRRLNLKVVCKPVRDTLDVWPTLPLLIEENMQYSLGADDIFVALGQSNRVCQVAISRLEDRDLEKVSAAMQVPFPELTDLRLNSYSKTAPVIPDSFLGGSTPYLRHLELHGIPFPGLPKLLSSTTHLVHLYLDYIPHSGYFSPEAMVALLSVLSCLEELHLRFQSPQSRPDRVNRLPPPSKRSVIPALRDFVFQGVIEYLEDLVTFIDAPQLHHLVVYLFSQVDALSTDRDRQVSSVARICNSCLPFLSRVETLYIWDDSESNWPNDRIDNTLWLELLLPFRGAKNLCLSVEFAPAIATALQEIVGTEVLPSLQKILVELEPSGPFEVFQENIGQFIAARELSGHSITISVWDGRLI